MTKKNIKAKKTKELKLDEVKSSNNKDVSDKKDVEIPEKIEKVSLYEEIEKEEADGINRLLNSDENEY